VLPGRAKAEGYRLIETFQEIETGAGYDALDKRQLAAALKLANKHKAPIIVASWIASAAMCTSSAG
jgi:hypothetical protein